MQGSGDIVEQGGVERLAPMFGVMLFRQQPVDIDDLRRGEARAGVKLRQLRVSGPWTSFLRKGSSYERPWFLQPK